MGDSVNTCFYYCRYLTGVPVNDMTVTCVNRSCEVAFSEFILCLDAFEVFRFVLPFIGSDTPRLLGRRNVSALLLLLEFYNSSLKRNGNGHLSAE